MASGPGKDRTDAVRGAGTGRGRSGPRRHRPSQGRRLAVLFGALTVLFAGIALAAAVARVWVVAVAAAALAAWMGSLVASLIRAR